MKKSTLFTLILSFLFVVSNVMGTTYYISTNGTGNGTTDWDNAAGPSSITGIINNCQIGDEIWFEAGTYALDDTYAPNDISIYGGFNGEQDKTQRDPESKSIIYSTNDDDGGTPLFSFTLSTNSIILDGFEFKDQVKLSTSDTNTIEYNIINCKFTDEGSDSDYINLLIYPLSACTLSVTVDNCIFDDDSVYSSMRQGIVVENGTAPDIFNLTIQNSTIKDYMYNGNNDDGAGLRIPTYNLNVFVSDCVFENNHTIQNAGAIYCNSPINIENSVFINNSADEGAALYLDYGYSSVSSCSFINNLSDRGGAIYLAIDEEIISFNSCLFANNQARIGSGGACYIYSVAAANFNNCTFANNDAQANGLDIYCQVNNEPIYVTNSIYYRSTSTDDYAIQTGVINLKNVLRHNSSFNSNTGSQDLNPIIANPLFVDTTEEVGWISGAEDADWHLQGSSPAFNAGITYTGIESTTDLDGKPRVKNGIPDIGAYETQPGITLSTNSSWTDNLTLESTLATSVIISNGNTSATYTIDAGGSVDIPLVADSVYEIYGTENITSLTCDGNIGNQSISSMVIDYAPSLTNLHISGHADLTSLDVSNCNALTSLDCHACNSLSDLTIGNLVQLTSLSCYSCNLSQLDIADCSLLYELNCSYNSNLSYLDAGDLSDLEWLLAIECALDSVNLSGCTSLNSLNFQYNNLSSIVIDNSISGYLYCNENNLKFSTLPPANLIGGTYSYSSQSPIPLPEADANNQIELYEIIDLSSEYAIGATPTYTAYVWNDNTGNPLDPNVDYIDLGNGRFKFISTQTDPVHCEMTNAAFSGLTLTTESFTTNLPTAATVSFTSSSSSDITITLKTDINSTIYVDAGDGIIKTLQVQSEGTDTTFTPKGSGEVKIYSYNLVQLTASSCDLVSIDISNSNSLMTLDIRNNTNLDTITELDSSSDLMYFYCDNCNFSSIDLTQLTHLQLFWCSGNPLNNDGLTFPSDPTSLTNFQCNSCGLDTLNVSALTNLEQIRCNSNNLNYLDLSSNTNLTDLECFNNNLTSINLTQNSAIESITCSNNDISTLPLPSDISQITDINCSNNKLTIATLPQLSITNYSYSPQDSLPMADRHYLTGETIDLSSQFQRGTTTTLYKWYDSNGNELSESTYYIDNNDGTFSFSSSFTNGVYCKMVNPQFPSLELISETIYINNITVTCIITNSCPNINNGKIDPNVVGDTYPYTYLWSDSNTLEDRADLAPGDYTVTITDSVGNQVVDTFTVGTVDMLFTPTSNSPVCAGSQLTIGVDNNFDTYQWNGPSSSESYTTQVVEIPQADESLHSGNWSVSVSKEGCTALGQIVVVVYPTPAIEQIDDMAACAGSNVVLSTTGNYYYYEWRDPAATTLAQNNNDTIYNIQTSDVGNYVLYVESDYNCTNTDTFNITVNEPPTGSLVVTNPVCANSVTDLQIDYSYATPSIDAGLGNINTDRSYTAPAYASDDSIILILSALEGCSDDTVVYPITVNALPTYEFIGGGTYCDTAADLTINLNGAAPFDFTYYVGTEANTQININANSYTITRPTDGIYSMTSLTDANGCEATEYISTAEIIINVTPNIPETANISYCQGDIAEALTASGNGNYEYIWYISETSATSVGYAPTPETTTAGQTTYFVSQKNQDCESWRVPIDVTINPLPVVETIENINSCVGDYVAFDVTDTYTNYKWLDSDGGTLIADQSYIFDSIVGSNSGNYYLKAVSDSGCIDSSQFTVTVNELPIVTFNAPNSLCHNDTAIDLNDYVNSTGGDFLGISATFNPLENVGVNAITYEYTDPTTNCKNWAYDTITVLQTTAPDITYDSGEIYPNDTLTLTAIGTEINWYKDEAHITQNATYNFIPETTGTYTFYVTNTDNGCVSDSIEVLVYISDPACDAVRPTVDATEINICSGDNNPTLTITNADTLGGTAYWFDASGAVVATGLSFTPDISIASNYTYSVVDSTAFCEASQATVISYNIYDYPEITSDLSDNICAYDEAILLNPEYNYSNNGTPIVGEFNPAEWADGTYEIIISQTVGATCTTTDTISVTITDPQPPIAIDVTCSSDTLITELTAEGTYITWFDAGKNYLIEGTFSYTHDQTEPNTYIYYVSNTVNGCVSDTISLTLTITAPEPLCDAVTPEVSDTAISSCEGDGIYTVELENSTLHTPYWFNEDGTYLSSSASLSIPELAVGENKYYVIDTTDICSSDTVEIIYTVHPYPTVQLDLPAGICSNDDPIVLNQDYQYTINPQVDISSGFDPSQYLARDYLLIASATENECVSFDTALISVTIPALPVADSVICTTDSIIQELTAEGELINWYNENMEPLSTDNIYVHGKTEAGLYRYYATNTESNCESDPVEVILYIIDPQSDAVLPELNQPSASMCAGNDADTVFITNTIAGTAYWYYQGAVIDTGNYFIPNVVEAGTYTYFVKDSTDSYSSSRQQYVLTVNSYPMITDSYNGDMCIYDSPVVLGNNAYTIGDSTISEINPEILGAGNYTLNIAATQNGCTTRDEFDFAIHETTIEQPQDVTCTTDSIPLTLSIPLSSSQSRTWYDDGYNVIPTNTAELVHGNTTAGVYTYYATNMESGCVSDTVSITLTINEVLCDTVRPLISNEYIELCEGAEPGSFTSASPATWFGEDDFINNDTIFTPSVQSPGHYNYSVIDATSACSDTAHLQYIINPAPEVEMLAEIEIEEGTSAILSAGQAPDIEYEWAPEEFIDGTNLSPVIRTTVLDDTTNYVLYLTNSNTGCTSEQYTTVNVVDAYIPVTSIIIPASAGIIQGDTVALHFDVMPQNATNRQITWSSTNSNIATVDQLGNIIAQTSGMVNIIATNARGTVTAVCLVTVSAQAVAVTQVVMPDTVEVALFDSIYAFEAIVRPYNATNTQLIWSADNDILNINPQTGVASLADTGIVIITATSAQYGIQGHTVVVINQSSAPVVENPVPGITVDSTASIVTIDLNDIISDDASDISDLYFTIADNSNLHIANENGIAVISGIDNITDSINTITIIITDTDGNTTEMPVTITIDNTVVNQPPVVGVAPVQNANPGDDFNIINLNNFVSDDYTADRNISYTADSTEHLNATIGANGELYVTPADAMWQGTDTIYVTATDEQGLSSVIQVVYNVTLAENQAPVISPIPGQERTETTDFHDINLLAYVYDDYTAPQNIQWSVYPSNKLNITIANGIASVSIVDRSWMGSEFVSFIATDEAGLSTAFSVNFSQARQPAVVVDDIFVFDFSAPYTLTTPNETIVFYANILGATEWRWFIDGVAQSTRSIAPTFGFDNLGYHDISLVVTNGTDFDTLSKPMYVHVIGVDQPDTVICLGNSITLTTNAEQGDYMWSNGSTESSITVMPEATTTYAITISEVFFEYVDSLTVEVAQPLQLGIDTSICYGTSFEIAAPGYESYVWSNGSVDQSITADTVADYSLTVTDEYGCITSDTLSVIGINSLPLVYLGETSNECGYETLTLDAGAYETFQWSTGDTTQTIDIDTSGIYSVTVVDNNGCSNSADRDLWFQFPYNEQLGVVTYSQLNNYLIVAWERTEGMGTDKYYVLRQRTASVWDTVAEMPYESEIMIYEDTTVDWRNRSYTYKLLTKDTCGNISDNSTPHSSIKLSANWSAINSGFLDVEWTAYSGVEFDEYLILRKGDDNQFHELDRVASSAPRNYSYEETDNTPELRIAIELPETVSPDYSQLKTESGPFSQALSNITEMEITDMQSIVLNAEIIAFPNPASEKVNILILTKQTCSQQISIIDPLGQTVMSTQIHNTGKHIESFSVSNFSSGVYTIKLETNDIIQSKTIIIE